MKINLKLISILLLLSSNVTFSQANNQKDVLQHKTITAKFIEAGVFEGAGTYTFEDTKGKKIYFVFDDYSNQQIPYHFFDNEAHTNEEWVNATFNIKYINKWEIRGESEEKIVVNRIVKIKLIKKY